MSETKPTEDPKVSKSPQDILENAIKKSPANNGQVESGKVDVARAASGVPGGAESTNNPAAHGYDEVKPPRPANDDNSYSTPRSFPRNGASDYLVPRSSAYEPVCAPESRLRVSSSYEIPRPTSPASPASPGIQPSNSGYMPLQMQPKVPDHYSSRDNLPSAPAKVTRSASKELITGVSREDLKLPNVPPRKSSRELVKTPSISRGLDILEKNPSQCTWNVWLSIAAIVVAVLSLMLSIASLGVSNTRQSSNNMAVTANLMNLTNRVDSIQSQVLSASRRPNCSSFVYDSCSFNATSAVYNACVTEMLVEDSPVSGISCGIDINRSTSEVLLEHLELFTARLYHSSEGYGCRCTLSNGTTPLQDSGWVDDISCVLIVSQCL